MVGSEVWTSDMFPANTLLITVVLRPFLCSAEKWLVRAHSSGQVFSTFIIIFLFREMKGTLWAGNSENGFGFKCGCDGLYSVVNGLRGLSHKLCITQITSPILSCLYSPHWIVQGGRGGKLRELIGTVQKEKEFSGIFMPLEDQRMGLSPPEQRCSAGSALEQSSSVAVGYLCPFPPHPVATTLQLFLSLLWKWSRCLFLCHFWGVNTLLINV